MAKRRPVRSAAGKSLGNRQLDIGGAPLLGQRSFTPASLLGLAAAMIAAAVVYAGYWPSDSIEVQTGGARYLVGLLLAAAALAWWVRGPLEPADWLIDALAWAVALWMVVATLANTDGANLRLAVNELWWWIAAAALLSATRRCVHSPAIALALLYLISAVAAAVAVFGWHQLLIGFPALIARYEAQPDAVLRDAGIFAEEGSAQRIIFENRLYDGGPTGTFALANSMAALLVGGVVVMVALAGQQWQRLSRLRRLAWTASILVTLGMLVASRSRSAVASIVLIAVIYGCLRLLGRGGRGGLPWRPQRGVLIAGMLAMMVFAGLGIAMSWRTFSQSEWIGQAPASVAIRVNYWRACARMLADSPLFGVGPGQFKARYETYRAAEMTEQIADPHNWIWQALTSGGLPAGLLLLGLAAAIAWRSARAPLGTKRLLGPPLPRAGEDWGEGQQAVWAEPGDDRQRDERQGETVGELETQSAPAELSFPCRRVYVGGAAAVAVVWIGGAAIGHLPTLDAALIATVAGILVLAVVVCGEGSPQAVAADGPASSRLALWAAAAMAIDLLAAGGLTVPGVAVTWWILAGIAAPCSASPVSSGAASVGGRDRQVVNRWVVGGAAAVLLLGWYLTAVLPVERATGFMGRFQIAWAQGRYAEAESALRQATEADRWDPEPALQLAQVLLQQALLNTRERSRWEASWHQAELETLRRAANDPVTIRVLADGRLWHYQRYGDAAQLQAAAQLYRRTVDLSPSHQTYAAQLAEIYRQLNDPRADELARAAQTLSLAGGYNERSLPMIIVMVAQEFGEQALDGPVRRRASDVLAPLLETPN